MVDKSKEEVSNMTFDSVLEDSNAFIATINGKLENIEISVETEFPRRKRIALKKRMAGESCSDERCNDPMDVVRVEVFTAMKDKIGVALDDRSSKNIELIVCIQYLDPRHFQKFNEQGGFSEEPILKLATLARFEAASLKQELLQFSKIFIALSGKQC